MIMEQMFVCYRGAHRFNDIIASASPESLKRIWELQTLVQPDEGCTIQYSSVRVSDIT
jgi:hypothetical protein